MKENDASEPTGVSRRLFLRSAALVTVGALMVPDGLLLGSDEPRVVELLSAEGVELDQMFDIPYKDSRVKMLYTHYHNFTDIDYRFNVRYLPLDKSVTDYRLELVIRNRAGEVEYAERLPMYGPVSNEPVRINGDRIYYPPRVRKVKFRLTGLRDLSQMDVALRLHR